MTDHLSNEIDLASERAMSPLVTPPIGMTDDEVEQTRQHAIELISGVRTSAGSQQLAVLDEVTSVGSRAQRNAGRQLELVTGRLADFADGGGSAKAISDDLVELRTVLDRVDPHRADRGLAARVASRVPGLRNRIVTRALTKVAVRHETVAKQVTVIERRLTEGGDLLARDNVELRQLYEDVETQQSVVRRQVFLGELLLEQLDTLAAAATDPRERELIGAALHDVAIRVQDLRTMDEVHQQYFVSIEMIRRDNKRLGHTVERTVALASNVVTVGLAIQSALVRQRRVLEANQRTREFLGEVLVRNAAAIREQSAQIGDLASQPVIALDRLTQAHDDLLAALDAAERTRADGLAAARANIGQLARLSQEMGEHVHGVEDR